MSNKKEVVVCAAVKERCGDEWDIELFVRYPKIMKTVTIGDIGRELGFITNLNRFVDAEEALLITGRQNQLKFKDRKYLLPEDLY